MDPHTSLRERVHHAFQGISVLFSVVNLRTSVGTSVRAFSPNDLEYDEQVFWDSTVRSCKVESKSYQVARVGGVCFSFRFVSRKKEKKFESRVREMPPRGFNEARATANHSSGKSLPFLSFPPSPLPSISLYPPLCPAHPLSLLRSLLRRLPLCVLWIIITVSSATFFPEPLALQVPRNLILKTNRHPLNISSSSSSTFPPHKALKTSPRPPLRPTSRLFSLI